MLCAICGTELKQFSVEDYPYTECGLDDVRLTGVIGYRCPNCGDTTYGIPNQKRIEMVIGLCIAAKASSLKGVEIRFIRKRMGLQAKQLAEILGYAPQTISTFETGKAKLSRSAELAIRFLYVFRTVQELELEDSLKSLADRVERFTESDFTKPLSIPIGNDLCEVARRMLSQADSIEPGGESATH